MSWSLSAFSVAFALFSLPHSISIDHTAVVEPQSAVVLLGSTLTVYCKTNVDVVVQWTTVSAGKPNTSEALYYNTTLNSYYTNISLDTLDKNGTTVKCFYNSGLTQSNTLTIIISDPVGPVRNVTVIYPAYKDLPILLCWRSPWSFVQITEYLMRIGSLNGEVLYVGRVFTKNVTSCYSLSEIAGLDNITDNQYYLSVRAATNELGLGSPSEGILVYLTKADGSSTPRGLNISHRAVLVNGGSYEVTVYWQGFYYWKFGQFTLTYSCLRNNLTIIFPTSETAVVLNGQFSALDTCKVMIQSHMLLFQKGLYLFIDTYNFTVKDTKESPSQKTCLFTDHPDSNHFVMILGSILGIFILMVIFVFTLVIFTICVYFMKKINSIKVSAITRPNAYEVAVASRSGLHNGRRPSSIIAEESGYMVMKGLTAKFTPPKSGSAKHEEPLYADLK